MSSGRNKIKALIVDDEPLARQTIRDLLAVDPDVEIIGECKSGLELVNFTRKQVPDLLFLDIQMPRMNGFEALAKIDYQKIPAIIFVTAFDKYALKAFEVNALDYLLKPFSDKRFREAVSKAKARIELREINTVSQSLLRLLKDHGGSQPLPEKQKDFLTRFMIKTAGRVYFINTASVDWITADDYYVKLHVNGKRHLLRISMNELEEKLDPKKFLRIHRSTIINVDRVQELQQNPGGDYDVVLKDGTELKLSRGRRERLEQLLMKG